MALCASESEWPALAAGRIMLQTIRVAVHSFRESSPLLSAHWWPWDRLHFYRGWSLWAQWTATTKNRTCRHQRKRSNAPTTIATPMTEGMGLLRRLTSNRAASNHERGWIGTGQGIGWEPWIVLVKANSNGHDAWWKWTITAAAPRIIAPINQTTSQKCDELSVTYFLHVLEHFHITVFLRIWYSIHWLLLFELTFTYIPIYHVFLNLKMTC